MHTSTKISTAVIEAYKTACFRVLIEDGFILRLEEVNHQLVSLFDKNQVESATFITAYNPFSQPTTEHENIATQAEMQAEITSLNLSSYPGQGEDPTGQWPGEVSTLVMGMGLEEAMVLGVKYQQNAIIWIGRDAKPQLILLR
jgi:hypothetical protein